ncbi:MAG: hypothetical protein ACFFC7_20655 [Candidatus Hermodarchaeota archaeon]
MAFDTVKQRRMAFVQVINEQKSKSCEEIELQLASYQRRLKMEPRASFSLREINALLTEIKEDILKLNEKAYSRLSVDGVRKIPFGAIAEGGEGLDVGPMLQALQDEREGLVEKEQALTGKLKDLEEELEEKTNKIAELEQSLSLQSSRLEEKMEEDNVSQSLVDEMRREITALNINKEKLDEELIKAGEELIATRAEIENLQAAIAERDNQNQALLAQLNEMKVVKDENSELRDMIIKAADKVESIQATLQEEKEKATELVQTLGEERERHEQTISELKTEYEQKITTLQENFEGEKTKLRNELANSEEFQGKIAQITQERDAARTELSQTKENLNQIQQNLENELNKTRNELQKTQEELKKTEEDLETYILDNEDTLRNSQAYKKSLDEMKDRVENLEQDLRKKEEEINELKIVKRNLEEKELQIESLRKQNDEFNEALQRTKQKLLDIQSESDSSKVRYEELRTENEHLKQNIEKLRETETDLRKEMVKLSSTKDDLSTQLTEKDKRHTELEQSNEELKARIASTEEMINKYRAAVDTLKRSLEENMKYRVIFLLQELKTATADELSKIMAIKPTAIMALARTLEEEDWVDIKGEKLELKKIFIEI